MHDTRWHVSPQPVCFSDQTACFGIVGGHVYRVVPISTDEWEDKKELFDEKTGRT